MIIGVDPHKASHTATALDPATNTPVSSIRIDASIAGYRQLIRWAAQFEERRWAIENAKGLGSHLTQWLIARDEAVVDVATTATSRVRELFAWWPPKERCDRCVRCCERRCTPW